MNKYVMIFMFLFSVIWSGSAANGAIIVGRISHVEGQIYRYMDVDDSWVETSEQAPAGTQDILMTGADSKAEIAFPNDLLIRIDRETEIEILNLDEGTGEYSLRSGLARFYNPTADGELTVETDRGIMKVRPGGVIDMQADRQSTTVSAVRGEAAFYTYENGSEKVDIISGTTSLEFRRDSTTASRGPVNLNWSRWCADRERVWDANRTVRSEYLPDTMQEYAYAIEPYGRWQKVYYRGYYYWAWSPNSIAVGWSPYTTGYWYDWQGAPVWIDYNPWGWVTHHYGYWIDLSGVWLWTPYIHVANVPGITVIGFNITFGKRYRPYWHPGRVRWITRNDYIGWLPLAPWETYYGSRRWGPRSVVVNGGVGVSINISIANHRHIDHAIIIPKRHLYDHRAGEHNNYEKVRIHNINKTAILKDYKPLPINDNGKSWQGKHAPGAVRTGIIDRGNDNRHGTRNFGERQVKSNENTVQRRDRSTVVNREGLQENHPAADREKDRKGIDREKYSGTSRNESEKIRQRDARNGIVRALPQNRQENADRNVGAALAGGSGERDRRLSRSQKVTNSPSREKTAGRSAIESSRELSAARGKIIASAGKDRRGAESSLQPKQKELDRKRDYRNSRVENDRRRKDNAVEEINEEALKRPSEGNSDNLRGRGSSGSWRDYDAGRKNWEANSFSGRRFR